MSVRELGALQLDELQRLIGELVLANHSHLRRMEEMAALLPQAAAKEPDAVNGSVPATGVGGADSAHSAAAAPVPDQG
ncbi:MAG TPA: hypothetical protein VHQ90_00085 [Thermoanaerobaculia bacterium]|nr:hypothetical protein [Thermoanaerobaculia bacterium]